MHGIHSGPRPPFTWARSMYRETSTRAGNQTGRYQAGYRDINQFQSKCLHCGHRVFLFLAIFIIAAINATCAGGRPLVVEDPLCSTSKTFMELGACVVREVAKLTMQPTSLVTYDEARKTINVRLPGTDAFCLHPATVRRNDTSAKSINEWTGRGRLQGVGFGGASTSGQVGAGGQV